MSTKRDSISYFFSNINLLKCSIISPASLPEKGSTFDISVAIENKYHQENKTIEIIVHIDVKLGEDKETVGTLSVSYFFLVENFSDFIDTVTIPHESKFPLTFIHTLNSISLSTTRGVMFSHFKGTFLHNVILPIIDPGTLQQVQKL